MEENGLDKRFQDEERSAFVKSIADKLYQGIKKIIDADETEKRRWIWELIQNAKDVQNTVGNGKVSIQIELNENELLFKHNGDPFKLSHLTGLLQQVSSKYGKETVSVPKIRTGLKLDKTLILNYHEKDQIHRNTDCQSHQGSRRWPVGS